jgi:hypothetical protein
MILAQYILCLCYNIFCNYTINILYLMAEARKSKGRGRPVKPRASQSTYNKSSKYINFLKYIIID